MLLSQNGERNMGSSAYALGNNEQSSFNRAFRRWTGQLPSTWLK
jgi:AraC-like DNA-binding protein